MEPFLGCQCYDSAVTGAWQVTGGSDWGMELSIVQCVHGSKQTEQTQQAEKIKIKKQISPPEQPKTSSERWGKSQGLEISVSAQMKWGVEGSPSLSAPPCPLPAVSCPLPSSTPCCPSVAPAEPLAATCYLSAGWGLGSLAQLDHPRSFSTGTWLEPLCFSVWAWTSSAGCQLAGQPHPGPLPYSRSVSSLLFPFFSVFFFSPPSSLPSIMEKQFRFSRFTERGKGRGNIHASSNKCFSSSPRRGNSSLGWWGFQPTSPSLCPWRQHLHAASIPPTAPGPKSHLPAASGGPMGTRRLMRCCPMEKPCPVLQANTELTNTEPVSPKLKSAVYLGMNYNYS